MDALTYSYTQKDERKTSEIAQVCLAAWIRLFEHWQEESKMATIA